MALRRSSSERSVVGRRAVFVAACAMPLASLLGPLAEARADGDRVTADVLVLHASTSDAGSTPDPRVAKMPQLARPPFSAFNTFKVLDQKALALLKGQAVSQSLANGQTLQLKLLDVTADRRFHVAAALTNAAGQTVLRTLDVKAAPDEPFFVAGQSFEGGTLVIGITLRK